MAEAILSTLEAELLQFTGSERFFKHSLVQSVIYTEGVRHLARAAGAYWLVDEIALANCRPSVKAEEFQCWRLTRAAEGNGAALVCDDGNGMVLFSKGIEFTDFPLASILLYCEFNGAGHTILLPSEH